MATYTPVVHQVVNELDNIGVFLNLSRLENESNASYKQRLFDVFVNRADSTYRGLINGITRELGLSLYKVMTIVPKLDDNGDIVGDNPAIIFEGTKCYIYSDYTDSTDGLDITLDRWEESEDSWTYGELITEINNTDYFTAAIQSGVNSSLRSMTIFNQSSVRSIPAEELSTAGPVINLSNNKLMSDSVSITSSNLKERVSSQAELIRAGQYYIDFEEGVIYTTQAPEPGSLIRYEYRDDEFVVWASPVIIHNLQSDDFKTIMF